MTKKVDNNIDKSTVEGFGDEWIRFDQSSLSDSEVKDLFESYFAVFPWNLVDKDSVGFDLGCGSGRWAKVIAPMIGKLHCIDPSDAINVAKRNLATHTNCVFHRASVSAIPLDDASMDFGYSLGVLHHIPNTLEGLKACTSKLKIGAPFLLYLYYRFDNRSYLFKTIWKISNLLRIVVSRLPHSLRYVVSQVIAVLIYFPLARTAKLLERIGVNIDAFPLSSYRDRSFYTMRTDALDRFGTQLEHRYTKVEIREMMIKAGLSNISFCEKAPYWCAVGIKK